MEYNTRRPEEGRELAGSVLLGRMPQQAEVRLAEDDWTGSTNAAERRKRQNRLHQRLYPLTPPQVQHIIGQVEHFISRQYMTSSPRADLLLTLIQFNVFRALFSNMIALGFNHDWLTADAISPFVQNKSRVCDKSCPGSLCPTALQRQVSHHPYLDLFPFPELRDNMLRKGEDFDDDDLCHDLVEVCHAPSERSGLIVWGSPWDPSSWEVTPEFVEKWPWMLRGCRELLHSTNLWRGKRGEEELYFDVTLSERIHS
ncbi:hypothetical protein BcDW1_8446 [Botrytis cinerea BcDW1]|uniref:Uncharacterized protein n=1 Tax=Botryotinia fuckeliana (strain BcDW1) TaxID=1290391 RepID=M7UH88_BOTF1|nr:hypothetical protein BcDW1_8446 [Botrytis cinerea BcDW1]